MADAGLLHSVGRLANTLLAIGQNRLELLSLDLEDDRAHMWAILLLTVLALFCLAVGTLLVTVVLVLHFWDEHRVLVLAVLAMTYIACGIGAWCVALHRTRTKPRLFTASLAELHKDREQVRRA